MHHASPLCESQQQRAEVPPNGWARQSPTFCDSSARPSSISLYPKVVDPSFQIFEFEYFDNSSDRHGRSSFSLPAIQLSLVSFQFVNGGVKMYRGLGGSLSCPSYKFRPAQKSGPFRVVPDSVCDPHTILRHGVLSNFRSRAMRQLEIIAPRHQRDVLGATSQASGWDTQNTRVSAPDGVYRRDRRHRSLIDSPPSSLRSSRSTMLANGLSYSAREMTALPSVSSIWKARTVSGRVVSCQTPANSSRLRLPSLSPSWAV